MDITILTILISITSITSAILALTGATIFTTKIKDAQKAEKDIKELIRNTSSLKQIRSHYIHNISDHLNIKDIIEIQREIEMAAKKSKNKEIEKRVVDALENNTEEGKKNYINNLILSA